MFTGFSSENTPAVQVWNFFRTYTGTASISLSDDCAPIQLIKTGGNTTDILLYLPSAPIEGKRITIQNSMYGSSAQKIKLFSSDISGSGSNTLVFTIGSACTIDLIYSKDFISNGVASGTVVQTGWVTLNFSPRSAYSYYSTVIASDNSNAYEYGSVVLGGANHSISAREAVVLGGASNSVFGLRGSVVGGTSNLAQGQYSGVYGGQSNTAVNTNSVVAGGQNHSANSLNSSIVGGSFNNATGSSAGVFAANNGSASAAASVVLGGSVGDTRSIIGYLVTPASVTPVGGNAGNQQLGRLLLGRQTTDATTTVIRSNTSAASTTNQVILPDNSAYAFQGIVIANVTGAGNTSGWKFEGVIKRGTGAASTALVAAVTPTVIAQDAGASAWVVAVTADTTNGGIKVEVTGAAATTIRWVCKIETTEVTY